MIRKMKQKQQQRQNIRKTGTKKPMQNKQKMQILQKI